jgi:hypothetical protein
MVDERMRVIEESNGLGTALDPLYDTPADQSRKKERSKYLESRQAFLSAQIEYARQQQASLTYAYPALSAIKGETGENPQDIEKVQSRLPGAFDGIRGNIDHLSGEVAKDPSVAVLFDSVVAAQLQDKSITAPQRQQLTEWLNSKREEKAQNAQLGMLASSGLFVASFVPQLKGISLGLRLAGIGVGGAVAASEIPDLMMLDAAAQAGLGGAGKLTSQSPEQAKFNLVMGYANVGLAGLDVGLEVGAVQKLAGLTGKLASAGVQVSRQQWSQAMEWVKQGPAGIEKAKAFLGSIKGLSKEKAAEAIQLIKNGFSPEVETVGVPGQSAVKTTEENVKDAKAALQAKTKGGGSATAKKKLKDMTPVERFADAESKYGQIQNWDQVKSLVGQSVTPNMQLPPGYIFYEKPANFFGKRSLFILRENANDASFVPLMIEKGKIQAGKVRLSRDLDVMKANLKGVGVTVPKDWQVNHLIPDEIAQSNPLMIEALKRDLFDVDRASNLLPMPGEADVRKANPNLIDHEGSHGKYSNIVDDQLTNRYEILKQRFGNNIPDSEIKKTLESVENLMRKKS